MLSLRPLAVTTLTVRRLHVLAATVAGGGSVLTWLRFRFEPDDTKRVDDALPVFTSLAFAAIVLAVGLVAPLVEAVMGTLLAGVDVALDRVAASMRS